MFNVDLSRPVVLLFSLTNQVPIILRLLGQRLLQLCVLGLFYVVVVLYQIFDLVIQVMLLIVLLVNFFKYSLICLELLPFNKLQRLLIEAIHLHLFNHLCVGVQRLNVGNLLAFGYLFLQVHAPYFVDTLLKRVCQIPLNVLLDPVKVLAKLVNENEVLIL